MGGIGDGVDAATWQALGLALTVLGLVVSAVVWSRRGPLSGLRGVAWSLLPLAAGLTGVLRLGWEVTDAVVSWATRVVFSPVVWLGIAVAAVSVVLFVVTGFARRRAEGRGTGGPAAIPGPAPQERKPLPGRRSSPAAKPPAGGDDDMDDIEAILRRHGIT
jgi:hypothetical protein